MTSHYQRTTKVLRENGFKHFKTEYWNPFSRTKTDLFHIIDCVAINPGNSIIGIQVCGSDFQSHIHKITVDYRDNSIAWLSVPGALLQLWSWRKLLVKRGGKAKVWKARIADFWIDDGKIVYKERGKE